MGGARDMRFGWTVEAHGARGVLRIEADSFDAARRAESAARAALDLEEATYQGPLGEKLVVSYVPDRPRPGLRSRARRRWRSSGCEPGGQVASQP